MLDERRDGLVTLSVQYLAGVVATNANGNTWATSTAKTSLRHRSLQRGRVIPFPISLFFLFLCICCHASPVKPSPDPKMFEQGVSYPVREDKSHWCCTTPATRYPTPHSFDGALMFPSQRVP